MKGFRIQLVSFFIVVSGNFYAQEVLAQTEEIQWQSCDLASNPRLQCANYTVPLTYSEKSPTTGFDAEDVTVTLLLVRQPATDASKRKGSLIVAPGGPGGSGVERVALEGPNLFGEEVRAHYDLIGFDPRGTNESTALTCLQAEEDLLLFTRQPDFPATAREERKKIALDKYLARACRKKASSIIQHMSTTYVARDMEALRQALGDEKLNFVGYSYSSFLGITYANLYPDKVGAFVLDGVVDPIALATGRGSESLFWPVSIRQGADVASMSTLEEFFRLCDEAGSERCALAGNSGRRFADIINTLKVSPVENQLPDGSTQSYGHQELIADTLIALYSSEVWQEFAQSLLILEEYLSGRQAKPANEEQSLILAAEVPPAEVADNIETDKDIVQQLGILCADSDNPPLAVMWRLAADYTERSSGYFGRFWTWMSSACVHWPESSNDRYTGPYSKPTANTILLIGTLFDPATGYHGAASAANILGNARLLTVDGWGHTAQGISSCADRAIADYLLHKRLPEEGAVCMQDLQPFSAMPE